MVARDSKPPKLLKVKSVSGLDIGPEESEVKTLYQYVVDLRDRVEETCKMTKVELAKVQVRNRKYYNKRTCDRKLQVGESVNCYYPQSGTSYP